MANIYGGQGKMQSPWMANQQAQRGANQAFRGALQQNPGAVSNWFGNQNAQTQGNLLGAGQYGGNTATPWGTVGNAQQASWLSNALAAGGTNQNAMNQMINQNAYNGIGSGGGIGNYSPNGNVMTGTASRPDMFGPTGRRMDQDTVGGWQGQTSMGGRNGDSQIGIDPRESGGYGPGMTSPGGMNQGTPGSWNPAWRPMQVQGQTGDVQGRYSPSYFTNPNQFR